MKETEKLMEKNDNNNKENSKNYNWKKIATIVIIISCLILVGLIIIIIVPKKESDNESKWEPKGNRIKTIWGEKLNHKNVWPENPRPQFERSTWFNLNGLWDYYITKKDGIKPDKPKGKILVPFPIESSLSGVMYNFTDQEELWYQRTVEIDPNWRNKIIYLHFDAVDWKATVYINNKYVGEHSGGYTPFYFDITNYINDETNKITITVKVYDPSDKSYQPKGKQVLYQRSIWYSQVSGIWQTVWLEFLNLHHFEKIDITPDFDNKNIKITPFANSDIKFPIEISLLYKDILIKKIEAKSNTEIIFDLNEGDLFHPWSPDDPNIYNIEVKLFSETLIEYDNVKTYTLLRKITNEKDSNGIYRMFLNNKILFQMGTLDQGYFPDGLYTPPSEEAMVYDIKKTKELGFNTIRKHTKVESSRFYYNCDIIGLLVWQDMPVGDVGGNVCNNTCIDCGTDKNRTAESISNFMREWGEIIDFCKFFQSIVVWVPFNEAMGQFLTEQVVLFTKTKDSSRLIDSASGGNYYIVGDIFDIHHYPQPQHFPKLENETNVMGEYGGLGLEIKGHTWNDDNWGYVTYNTTEQITEKYEEFSEILIKLMDGGISAAIYTQITDVEREINGLITYDRKEMKIIEERIIKANKKVIDSLK